MASTHRPATSPCALPFVGFGAGGERLSACDQLQAIDWQESARPAGWRIALWLHDQRDDAAQGGDLLSVYRTGEARPRWNLARLDASFTAFCCSTGEDLGPFPSMRNALEAVFQPSA